VVGFLAWFKGPIKEVALLSGALKTVALVVFIAANFGPLYTTALGGAYTPLVMMVGAALAFGAISANKT